MNAQRFPIHLFTTRRVTRPARAALRLLAVVALLGLLLPGPLGAGPPPAAADASAASIVGPPIEIDRRVKRSVLPAVAYNPVHDEYLVVWANFQDDWSHDIWARRVTGQGVALDAPFCVSTFPAEYHENPAVAFNPVTEEYLVAYVRQLEGSGYTDVYARRLHYDGDWISDPVQLSWGGGYH
ncbi:MAG: hypothetical protein R6X16_07790, partial [Anaerolineae bacterium]